MDRILVFAPHPDDETIGCGGLIARSAAKGAAIRVVVVTDGGAGLALGGTVAERQTETRAALTRLGVRDAHFWNYPDGGLPLGGDLPARYRAAVAEFRPNVILLPHPAETHVDHRALSRGLLRALEGRWQGALWFYETVHACQPVNRFEDITDTLPTKLAALACHRTQTDQHDYVRHCELLAALRGLSVGCTAAEAYLAYEWDGSAQDFFVGAPWVSVIVRAGDDRFLADALDALAAQTYPWFEAILVWFGDAPPPDPGRWSFPLRIVLGERNRATNLNLGIEAASGELIAFLDDDDIVYAEHLSQLVEELLALPKADLVYGGTRVVRCRTENGATRIVGEVAEMRTPYTPGRLLFGNYITLNAVLARRHVFKTLRFDPALPAYEDWDFLARMEQTGHVFVHLDEIICEYRLHGGDEETSSIEAAHRRKGHTAWRTAVRHRIAARMGAADLDRLEAYAERHTGERERLEQQVRHLATETMRLGGVLERHADVTAMLRAAALEDASLSTAPATALESLLSRHRPGPRISIVFPTYNTDPRLLAAALQSIFDQTYERWQLCVVDDASDREDTRALLARLERRGDSRIAVRRRAANGGIVAASNDALALVEGDCVAFVDHDDLLAADAFWHVAAAFRAHPDAKLVYTDNRMIDHVGNVLNVFEKPDWSPQTLFSYNYINHLTVVATAALTGLGGLRQNYVGCQDWDLLLRLASRLKPGEVVHIARPLYDWRATHTSVSYSAAAKPWLVTNTRRLLADTLSATLGKPAEVTENPLRVGFLVSWEPAAIPLRVLIPAGDDDGALARCLAGLRRCVQHPQHLGVTLIGRDLERRCAHDSLAALCAELAVRRIERDRSLSWAAAINLGMADTREDAVLLLDATTQAMDDGWLDRLLRYLDLSDVGAVGALLASPDRAYCHAGIVTDMDDIAREVDTAFAPYEAASVRNVSAVSGAALLTRRSAFVAAGELDERLPDCFADVDYCLALRLTGYQIALTNDVCLLHHGMTPGERTRRSADPASADATRAMRTKWGNALRERYRITYRVAATTRILDVAP